MKPFVGIFLFAFLASPLAPRNVNAQAIKAEYTVTLIELGSLNCVPCKKMQGVIKAIDTQYSQSVKTIFYNVWTSEGKPYADLYNVDLIPVQVFLDKTGKEFFRHVGFFSEKEIINILKSKGVRPNSK